MKSIIETTKKNSGMSRLPDDEQVNKIIESTKESSLFEVKERVQIKAQSKKQVIEK